jgi:hypothetical protein
MSQQRKIYSTGDTENDDNLSTSYASEWDSNGLNGNVLAELKLKMAAFEVCERNKGFGFGFGMNNE